MAEIRPAFGTALFIQVIAELLNEAALSRINGELAGIELFGMFLVLGAMIDPLEEAHIGADYMDILEPSVEESFDVLQDIKGIMARWYGEEINSATVIEEMFPILSRTDSIAVDIDDVLAEELALDREEMRKYRDELKVEIQSVFEDFQSD